MFGLYIPDHGSDNTHPMLDRSASVSGVFVVSHNRNLNDSKALAVGLPQDFRTCTHVCFEGINRGDRCARVGSETALSIRDFPTMSSAKVRELRDYANP